MHVKHYAYDGNYGEIAGSFPTPIGVQLRQLIEEHQSNTHTILLVESNATEMISMGPSACHVAVQDGADKQLVINAFRDFGIAESDLSCPDGWTIYWMGVADKDTFREKVSAFIKQHSS